MTEETAQEPDKTEVISEQSQEAAHAPEAEPEVHQEEAIKPAEEKPVEEPIKEKAKLVEQEAPKEEPKEEPKVEDKPTEEPVKQEEASKEAEAPAQAQEPVAQPEPAPEPEPAPVVEQPEAPAAVVQPAPEDNGLVAQLNARLVDFVNANTLHGAEPKNFTGSANLALSITNFVIKHPKVEVLDALLDFFKDNIGGVCSHEEFLKGSTTLGKFDEQRVGYLFNLFSELAKGIVMPVNTGLITSVLKGPEIPAYFNRRVAFLRQQQGKK